MSRFGAQLGHLPKLDEPKIRRAVNRWFSEGALVLVEKYKPHSGGGGRYFALGSLEDFQRLVGECEPTHVVFLGRWRPDVAILDEAIIRKVAADQARRVGEPFVALESFFPVELDASYPEDELDIEECIAEYGGKRGWHGRLPEFPSCYWEPGEDRSGIVITRT